ncbi:MAG: alpha/beta fold hydrolase [Dehalococcoidia bacterium]|nr:alpha/beta fold hydrolase [Dehalococcoidia bacterium]
MSREVTVQRDGVRLAARLLTPQGSGAFPCVLFVHGLGSDSDSPRNVVIAGHLVDHGIAALLFDLSGHGQSDPDPSGLAGSAEDVIAAFDRARALPEIDAQRVGIAGSSLGGVLALEALAGGRIAPAAMVLRAPPIMAGELRSVHVPTLVIIGSADPLLWGVRAAAEGVPMVKLEVIPGAGHLFEETGALERASEATIDWFARHLHPAGALAGR